MLHVQLASFIAVASIVSMCGISHAMMYVHQSLVLRLMHEDLHMCHVVEAPSVSAVSP